ncbi:MAG TPA: hypothetical protein VE978_07200 [Chitinophagales bacterium]|nr:hypothetical protein [Chitinophagales bacterium]
MKKRICILTFVLIIACNLACTAQIPEAINYQAVARNQNGQPLINQSVSFRLSVIEDSIGGNAEYVETHSLITNQFGLCTIQIGLGTVITGLFSQIAWDANTKFLKVEFDPTGGSNFVDMATTQFISVPYSLLSKKSLDTKHSNTLIYLSDGF